MSTDREPKTRKALTLPDWLWQEIADFRFTRRVNTEIEAVRRLVVAGLRAERVRTTTHKQKDVTS
jgi:hypothetical protein